MKLIKKTFSQDQYDLEDYINDIEERAFSEGYEYAQREFAKKYDDEEGSSKSNLKHNLGVGAGMIGTGYIGKKSSDAFLKSSFYKNRMTSEWNKLDKALKDEASDPESKQLVEKLKAKAKSQGINIYHDPKFDNSAHVEGGAIGRGLRYAKKKLLDKSRDKNLSEEERKMYKEWYKGLDKGMREGSKVVGQHFGKDAVVMGTGDSGASVLAHELGHAQYSKPTRAGKFAKKEGGILGKAAHKLGAASKMLTSPVGAGILSADGFRRGYNSVEKDEENGGTKTNKKAALKSLGIGALAAAPVLGMEAAASRRGIKMLKEAGASKKYIENSQKTLKHAWNTYALHHATLGLGGEALGHGLGVATGKIKKGIDSKKDD